MKYVVLPAFIIFALDQLSKYLVLVRLDLDNIGEYDLLPPYLVFRMAWNPGINFGLFAGQTELARWTLIILSLVIVAWIWRWAAKTPHNIWVQLSVGVLIGGALGNVIDRLLYGAVVDFLNMSCCGIENPYAFNIADIAIFAGAAGLIFFGSSSKKSR